VVHRAPGALAAADCPQTMALEPATVAQPRRRRFESAHRVPYLAAARNSAGDVVITRHFPTVTVLSRPAAMSAHTVDLPSPVAAHHSATRHPTFATAVSLICDACFFTPMGASCPIRAQKKPPGGGWV